MNNKTISKIVVTALPAICVSTYNVSNCNAGELLTEIRKQQDNLLLLGNAHTREKILQRVIKNYDDLNEKLHDALDTL